MSRRVKLPLIISVSVLLVLALTYAVLGFVCIYRESYASGEDLSFGERCSIAAGEMFSENSAGDIFRKISYMITARASSDGVVYADGFLFPIKTESFDYKSDFKGEYAYSEEQCAQIKSILEQRAEKYENAGSEYYLFIIPNSQSVYSEKVPFADFVSDNTRARSLVRYLSENSEINVHFPLEQLSEYGAQQCIYNNTENSLNEVGAYKMYQQICSVLPEGASLEKHIDTSRISCVEGMGKSLAESLNMHKTIKNKTYYFENADLKSLYNVQKQDEWHSVTACKAFAGAASVLIQIPHEGERAMLKEFFCSSYSSVTVCDSHIYCDYTMDESVPDAVVQIVREDALDCLLDETAKSSYDMSDSEKIPSEAPSIDARFTLERGYITVVGKAKSGDTIKATCGRNKANGVCVDGFYMITIKTDGSSKVGITATSKGKGASNAVYTDSNVQVSRTETVTLGTSSRMFFNDTLSDFVRDNAYTEREIAFLKKNVSTQLKKIRTATGKNTEMIILCGPNPATIYGQEEMPSYILKQVKDNESRLESLNRELGKIDGVTTIDITQELKDNAKNGKLYYLTDTHWTELGAYYGYRAIMNNVSAAFPSAAPYAPEELKITYGVNNGGDMAEFLGIEKRITENVPHLSVAGRSMLVSRYDKPDTINRPEATGDFTTKARGASLPVAYMLRDSYSMQMIPLIGEHFSTLYYEEMWNYEIDFDALEELKPDYVIYVIAERNINVAFMR